MLSPNAKYISIGRILMTCGFMIRFSGNYFTGVQTFMVDDTDNGCSDMRFPTFMMGANMLRFMFTPFQVSQTLTSMAAVSSVLSDVARV